MGQRVRERGGSGVQSYWPRLPRKMGGLWRRSVIRNSNVMNPVPVHASFRRICPVVSHLAAWDVRRWRMLILWDYRQEEATNRAARVGFSVGACIRARWLPPPVVVLVDWCGDVLVWKAGDRIPMKASCRDALVPLRYTLVSAHAPYRLLDASIAGQASRAGRWQAGSYWIEALSANNARSGSKGGGFFWLVRHVLPDCC